MRILGLDIGSWSIKATELESRFRRLEITNFNEVRLPLAPTPDDYRAAIAKILTRTSGRIEKVVAAMPPHQVTMRYLTLPVKQRKKVEQMYRFELEDTVPFKLDDAIVEHQVLKAPEGSFVVAGIAQRKHVQAQIDALTALGIDPDWLTFDGMGSINCWLNRPPQSTEETAEIGNTGPIGLLDIGHKKTVFSVWEEDRLAFFRVLTWGGSQITESIARTRSLSLEDAEAVKHEELALDRDDDDASEVEREMVGAAGRATLPLITELNHCLVSYRSQREASLQRVMMTGGTALLSGMDRVLNRGLGVPIQRFSPIPALPKKGELQCPEEMRFGESMGRALVFQRKVGLLFNFRKQGLGKETSLTEVTALLKHPLVVTGLKLVGVLVLILLVHVNVASVIADREVKAATDELRKTLGEAFREVPVKQRTLLANNPKELQKFLQKKEKDVDAKLKALDVPRRAVLPTVLAVSAAFPPTVKVDVNVLEVAGGKVRLEGVLYEGALESTVEAMKKIPSIKNVQLSRDGQRFTIEADWNG